MATPRWKRWATSPSASGISALARPNTLPSESTVPLCPGMAEYNCPLRTAYQPALEKPNNPSSTNLRPKPGTSKNAGKSANASAALIRPLR